MNIFYLDNDTKICAQMHVDKHCVKMILESAQLLSTAHRVLDGQENVAVVNNRKRKQWKLFDHRDSVLYSATHINHPSAVWARQSMENYQWLYNLFKDLIQEYTYRYGKSHKCSTLLSDLQFVPNNIAKDRPFTEPTPAMPEQYKVPGNSVKSYHNYYLGEKQRMFSWKNRNVPEWVKIGS
jgi:hypothetical protein